MLLKKVIRAARPNITITYVDGSMVLRWHSTSYTQRHTPSFSTLISKPNNWALSSLCFYVFLYLSFSRITCWSILIYSHYIFSPFFPGLISPLSHTCVLPALLGIPCLVRVAIIFVDLFLVSYSTPLNKLEIFKRYVFVSFHPTGAPVTIIYPERFILTIKTG